MKNFFQTLQDNRISFGKFQISGASVLWFMALIFAFLMYNPASIPTFLGASPHAGKGELICFPPHEDHSSEIIAFAESK